MPIPPDLLTRLLGRKVATVYVALTRIHRALGECIRKKQAEEATADD
jgi:hypothetical protein